MTRVFISQPMNGKTDDQIDYECKKAIKELSRRVKDDIIIIESRLNEDAPKGVNVPLWYLSKSLTFLSTAELVYCAEGWEKARGCRIERQCAIEYGIPTMDYEG